MVDYVRTKAQLLGDFGGPQEPNLKMRNLIETMFSLDAGHFGVRPSSILPSYYTGINFAPGSGTTGVTVNRLYASPVALGGSLVNRIGVEIQSSAAGNVRCGLYLNDPATGGPTGEPFLGGGELDASVAAIIEEAVPLTELPKFCWFVSVFSATPTVRLGTADNGAQLGSLVPSTNYRGIYAAYTYGALPKLPITWTSYSAVAPMPLLRYVDA